MIKNVFRVGDNILIKMIVLQKEKNVILVVNKIIFQNVAGKIR